MGVPPVLHFHRILQIFHEINHPAAIFLGTPMTMETPTCRFLMVITPISPWFYGGYIELVGSAVPN